MYFSSEFDCKLDEKGRLALPARLKADLPESSENRITIKRGFEPCLTLYPQEEWSKIFSRVAQLDEFNAEQRRFQRTFLRGCTEVELDKSGRFLLPKSMIRYARLEREVILVGMGNRIEIWNPELYEEYLIADEEEFSELAEKYLAKPETPVKEESGVVVNINRAEVNQTEESDDGAQEIPRSGNAG